MTVSGGALAQFDPGSVFLLVITIVVFIVPIFILFPPIPVERSDALRQTHSKLGVRLPDSNRRPQHTEIHGPQAGQPAKIQSLYIYPIESCRGIELSRTKVLPHGLEHDRLFTFAQLKPKTEVTAAEAAVVAVATTTGGHDGQPGDWEVLTPRLAPLLAKVKVDIWLPDEAKTSRQLGKLQGGFVVARFPWTDKGLRGLGQLAAAKLSRGLSAVPEREFMLPLEFPSKADVAARGYSFANVRVWEDTPCLLNMQRELPPELARYLGVKHQLGLFRMDPVNEAQVFRRPRLTDAPGEQPAVDFQEGYPLYMLSLTSVRGLEAKGQKDHLIQRLDARSFRANIIISGAEEHDEEYWKSVQFKSNNSRDVTVVAPRVFDVSCRAVRCNLPNVDPTIPTRHKVEPDQAVREHGEIDDGAPKTGCLGMQLRPVSRESSEPEPFHSFLEVGMEMDVLKRGSQPSLVKGQGNQEVASTYQKATSAS